MTLQEVNEYRKLCANFCGWVNLNDESFPEYLDESGNFFGVKDLLFDTDWNWIKSVLEKISSLNEDDFSDETQQAFDELLDLSLFSSKQSVCESINNFIKTIYTNESKIC